MLPIARWLPAGVVLALAIAVAPALLRYVQHSWDVLVFPWQIDFDEGVNLNSSWLLSQGANIYRPYTADHFVSALYPPLFYALNALALKLWGLNLWSGRLLALLGALGVGAGLWAWGRAETGKHTAGLLAALLWFSLGPTYVWSTFYKQDMPALALAVLGGARAAFHFQGANGSGRKLSLLYLSIVPLALSFWMKQSSLAAFAAVGLAVLLRDPRLGMRWGSWAAASILVPFAAFGLLTRGGFVQHMLAFNQFGRSTARFSQRFEALWTYHWPLVVCGLAFLLVALSLPLLRKSLPPLSALFLLVSIPATALGILHPTGNYNHLLNILAPLCLALGVSFGWAWTYLTKSYSPAGWALVALCALAAVGQLVVQPSNITQTWYTPLGMPLSERAGQMEKLSALAAAAPGDVFSEDSHLLLHNGKRVLYDDTAGMTALARSGEWDQSVLLSDLSRRKFSLLLLQYDLTGETYNPRWTDQALSTARENYAIQFRDVLFAHSPRPPAARPEVALGCQVSNGPLLEGHTFRSQTANHGDVLPLSLYWEPRSLGGHPDVKYFVRLVDGSGAPRWSADLVPGQVAGGPGAPGAGSESVRDDLSIPIQADFPVGRYILQFGAYSEAGGQIAPLPVNCAGAVSSQGEGVIILSSVEVTPRWGR